MKLLTQAQRKQLLANGRAQREAIRSGMDDITPLDPKLFTPDGGATWLLTELDPEDPTLAFGLCDLGIGFPELGYVSLAELAEVRGRLGLSVERDQSFQADQPISTYLAEALRHGRIRA